MEGNESSHEAAWIAELHNTLPKASPTTASCLALGAGDFKQSLCCWWHISQVQANTVTAKTTDVHSRKYLLCIHCVSHE